MSTLPPEFQGAIVPGTDTAQKRDGKLIRLSELQGKKKRQAGDERRTVYCGRKP
jgi:hypothetical protein